MSGPQDITPSEGMASARRVLERAGADMVNVRLVVREVERYERVVRMPRALFELNRERLAAAGPDVVDDVACLLVDAFVSDHGDDFTEHTEIEAFEVVGDAQAADLVVNPPAEG